MDPRENGRISICIRRWFFSWKGILRNDSIPRRNSHETAIIAIFHSIHSIIYTAHTQLSRERNQQRPSVTCLLAIPSPIHYCSLEKRKKSVIKPIQPKISIIETRSRLPSFPSILVIPAVKLIRNETRRREKGVSNHGSPTPSHATAAQSHKAARYNALSCTLDPHSWYREHVRRGGQGIGDVACVVLSFFYPIKEESTCSFVRPPCWYTVPRSVHPTFTGKQ